MSSYAPILRYCCDPSDVTLCDLTALARAQFSRYSLTGDLLICQIDQFGPPRKFIPLGNDLRARVLREHLDSAISGNLSNEKTYLSLPHTFYWTHMYKWVRKWVRSCEVCQRVKPSRSSRSPLYSLPVANEAQDFVSMDFIFSLPTDAQRRTGIFVVVDHFNKMVHLAPVVASITSEDTVTLFINIVFRHHDLPSAIVSYGDPRFKAALWSQLFRLFVTRLLMSMAAHPEAGGRTERANRVLEGVLRRYAASYTSCSEFLPVTEFAMNNAVNASTGLTPFFVNNARHPRSPVLLRLPGISTLGGKRTPDAGID